MQVLVVEDDAVSRLLMQQIIKGLGHECSVAENGLKALEILQNHKPEVIISDWVMPGMDGLELCQRVRQHIKEFYPYFIFLTSLDDKKHLVDGILNGADDYLQKPLQIEELKIRLIVAQRITKLHLQLNEKQQELEEKNHLLFYQSRHDQLTQLYNRMQLVEDLKIINDEVRRYQHSYCAVLCDVDYFKQYNDYYGHLAGDKVLQAVAGTIRSNCRKGDRAYRYGGEEFLILLPYQNFQGATAVAEKLRLAVQELEIPHGQSQVAAHITMSAGISDIRPEVDKTIEEWIHEADMALYDAKARGRNRSSIFGD